MSYVRSIYILCSVGELFEEAVVENLKNIALIKKDKYISNIALKLLEERKHLSVSVSLRI